MKIKRTGPGEISSIKDFNNADLFFASLEKGS